VSVIHVASSQPSALVGYPLRQAISCFPSEVIIQQVGSITIERLDEILPSLSVVRE